ncbi:hypothetical protein A2U01_0104683, partial [Trifolium medium]|nr:hypothetical protein [Trifolium medium]
MAADVRRPKGQEKDEVGPSRRGNERRKEKGFVNQNPLQASLPGTPRLMLQESVFWP